MDLGLQDKRALIMASSRGLGKAVAFELAKEGCKVVICGRNKSVLEMTAKEIIDVTGVKVDFIQGDLSIKHDRDNICKTVKKLFGTIDILVTNTGGPPPGLFEVHDEGAWEQAYKSLVESAVGVIKTLLPGMKSQKWGRIILITSQAVKQPVESLVLSNAMRASLTGLMKTLSNELGSYNITVNSVLPGYTRTERLEKLIKTNPGFSEAVKEIPLGRIAEVEEFASAVTFLASERASYITGVSLPVDGGWIKGI